MRARAIAVGIASVVASPALAQEQPTQSVVQPATPPPVRFQLGGGLEHDFETDIDDGGEFELTRLTAGITSSFELTPGVGMRLFAGVEHWQYDFSGATGFGGLDPWDDVQTVSFAANASVEIAPGWRLSGGPLLQFSWESGADMSSGLQGGGAFALTHKVSDRLTIGGGAGIVSQIDDDVRIFPAVIVEYQFNDRLRATSRSSAGGRPFSGVELAYDLGKGWELGLGVDYRVHRFRLDDDGVAPDGVGESTGVPLWLRATYAPDPSITIDGFVGIVFGGELLLEDDDGRRLAEQDYDATLAVGIGGTIRF